eukprot:scaffold7428_cov153-Amphora_coffeaeformis.AAC.6
MEKEEEIGNLGKRYTHNRGIHFGIVPGYVATTESLHGYRIQYNTWYRNSWMDSSVIEKQWRTFVQQVGEPFSRVRRDYDSKAASLNEQI